LRKPTVRIGILSAVAGRRAHLWLLVLLAGRSEVVCHVDPSLHGLDDARVTLILNRVDGNGGLASLAVADNQLPSAANREIVVAGSSIARLARSVCAIRHTPVVEFRSVQNETVSLSSLG
jgi:hypothetical protein